MMETIFNAMSEFSNGPYYLPVLVMLAMIANNLITYKLMTREGDKKLRLLSLANRSERRRSTETINALRGIIYAFSDAQQQDEEPEEIPPYSLPRSSNV